MKAIEEYFQRQAKSLQDQFADIRTRLSDRDVKGGANEQALKAFLAAQMPGRQVVTNCQVIDSLSNSSHEIDVCVCNDNHPFSPKDHDWLICEGVALTAQVKAVLSTHELERVVQNCDKAKVLTRQAAGWIENAAMALSPGDRPYYLDRIPYVVFAYESELTLETARERLQTLYKNIPFERQLDAVFVLDRGCIYNYKEGKGTTWTQDGKNMKGFCLAHWKDYTLLEFVRWLHQTSPRIIRSLSPILNYFQSTVDVAFDCELAG